LRTAEDAIAAPAIELAALGEPAIATGGYITARMRPQWEGQRGKLRTTSMYPQPRGLSPAASF
jgi:hypothetical protein